MRVLAVIPYVDQALYEEASASLTAPVTVIPWDNTNVNLGVAAAWAVGADLVVSEPFDWLMLWSTSIVFGECGGQDLLDVLDGDGPRYESGPCEGERLIVSGIGCGWKLIAIPARVVSHVGSFDAHYVSYYEDTDWIYRHTLSGLGDLRVTGHQQVQVNLFRHRGDGYTIRSGVPVDLAAPAARYGAKWGGQQGAERFTHPFNNPAWDWTYTGPPPGGAA